MEVRAEKTSWTFVSTAKSVEQKAFYSLSTHLLLDIFRSKPLCPHAVEVMPVSQADEMMSPHLGIIGTRWPQPSQNISFLTAFIYLPFLVVFL